MRKKLKQSVFEYADRYRAGMSAAEVAAATGATVGTVKTYMSAWGVHSGAGPGPRRKLPSTAAIIAFIRMGGEPVRLAREFKATLPAIYERLSYDGFRLSNGVVEHDYLGVKRGTLAQRINRVADIERQVDRLIAEHKAEVAARRMAA